MDNPVLRVLLIEENPADARAIRALLDFEKGVRYQVDWRPRLSAAFECLSNNRIDVILLDLATMECRGIEIFRKVHAEAPCVPIVVLSGRDDQTLAMKAIYQGAEDYLSKDRLDDNVLERSLRYAIARNRTEQALTQQAAELAEANERLKREVEKRKCAQQTLLEKETQLLAARRIQDHLLPDAAPILPGFDIAAACYPADLAAGDYFDYFPMLAKSVAFAIGDVSGHGIGSALIMASTQACVRSLAETHWQIGKILTRVNAVLAGETSTDDYVTLLLGRLTPHTRSFAYASAGHQTGYILDSSGAVKARLESTALPLAVLPAVEFPVSDSITLESGDVVLLLTDGIPEARSPKDVVFGMRRTLEIVSANRNRTAGDIIDTLYRAVREFSPGRKPIDDITAIVIKAV